MTEAGGLAGLRFRHRDASPLRCQGKVTVALRFWHILMEEDAYPSLLAAA